MFLVNKSKTNLVIPRPSCDYKTCFEFDLYDHLSVYVSHHLITHIDGLEIYIK